MAHSRLFVLAALLATGASAQWLDFPTPGIPRTRDGKPNLSAPAPRAADGKPDLSGVWMHEISSVAEMRRLYGPVIDEQVSVQVPGMEIGTQHKYFINILLDFKPGESPLRPEAEAAMRRNADIRETGNPCSRVFGFPLAGLLSEPIKIVQSPRVTLVLYEVDNLHRQIFTDGRVLPKEFELPAYLGYSAGHWDHDVLVVETAGFNDKTAFDTMGHPHSEALRVTERFHRRDFGHMDVEMTFDDPKMYTQPFTIKVPHDLLPDSDILEMFCNENERDAAHMQKK
jgi:hypothetical protein